jgi:hypothetical protein
MSQQSIFNGALQINAGFIPGFNMSNNYQSLISYPRKEVCKHRDLNGWCARSNRECPLMNRVPVKKPE